MGKQQDLPLAEGALAMQPAMAFVEGALRRTTRILRDLEAMDCADCGRCAAVVDEELRVMAAEAYFFGLVRSHRLMRDARASLAFEQCGVGHVVDREVGTACMLLLRLRGEIRLELDKMIEEWSR